MLSEGPPGDLHQLFSIRPWRKFFCCMEVHLLARKGKKVPFNEDEVSSEISMGVDIVEL